MIALPDTEAVDVQRPALRSLLWLAFFALLLFVPAGTLRWPGAWVFLAIMVVTSLGGMIWLARHDPALFKDRTRPPFQRDQKLWDKVLMGAFLPLWIGWFVLMGLDRRFAWSSVPVGGQALGVVLIGLCLYLCWLVFRENSFAAPVVKLQKERGHKVVTSGPYAYVRHPMYTGIILFVLGAPLLLGSWWGLCLAPLLILMLGFRAVMEERMLTAELDGYADYAARVRYRLVPLLW
jgi:protein-S-isoprenylcysteine O-methyltransferase Ste14